MKQDEAKKVRTSPRAQVPERQHGGDCATAQCAPGHSCWLVQAAPISRRSWLEQGGAAPTYPRGARPGDRLEASAHRSAKVFRRCALRADGLREALSFGAATFPVVHQRIGAPGKTAIPRTEKTLAGQEHRQTPALPDQGNCWARAHSSGVRLCRQEVHSRLSGTSLDSLDELLSTPI